MVHVLYNTFAGAHYGKENIKDKMENAFVGEELCLVDITTVEDKRAYLAGLTENDRLVIVGGDGTLNKFVNSIDDIEYPFPIYAFAAGTGNDFINDVMGVGTDNMVEINDYIRDLPTVEVNGRIHKFLNGIGYGIDGYCCEEGDKYREKTGKAPNYTSFAIRGALYAYKPTGARVTVDGVMHEFKNVWLAPAMNGKYFGGGMKIAPEQDRLNEERNLTFVIAKTASRLRILTVFPKIFTGEHVRYEKVFTSFTGKTVTVEFDRPTALQVDGETVLGVTSYTVRSSKAATEADGKYVPV